ncbi:MAG: WGR domain-containing protein [Solirubrobacteraceae bacterium]
MDPELAGLWERPIPGQLRLPLEHATRPLIAARIPAPARPEWASQAATGGLVLSFQDTYPGRGMARWYGLHLQERLDGGVDVIRRWGRLGVRSTRPRQLAEPYPDWLRAHDALEELLARRAARGYQWAA